MPWKQIFLAVRGLFLFSWAQMKSWDDIDEARAVVIWCCCVAFPKTCTRGSPWHPVGPMVLVACRILAQVLRAYHQDTSPHLSKLRLPHLQLDLCFLVLQVGYLRFSGVRPLLCQLLGVHCFFWFSLRVHSSSLIFVARCC